MHRVFGADEECIVHLVLMEHGLDLDICTVQFHLDVVYRKMCATKGR